MRALLVGDVVGGVGLRSLLARLPELREAHRPDVVVVNAENAAAGASAPHRRSVDDPAAKSLGPRKQGARIGEPVRATDDAGSAMICSPPDRQETFGAAH